MKKGALGSFQTVDKVILRQRKGLGNKLFITLLRKAGFACRPFPKWNPQSEFTSDEENSEFQGF